MLNFFATDLLEVEDEDDVDEDKLLRAETRLRDLLLFRVLLLDLDLWLSVEDLDLLDRYLLVRSLDLVRERLRYLCKLFTMINFNKLAPILLACHVIYCVF